jgi:hypothetical protein
MRHGAANQGIRSSRVPDWASLFERWWNEAGDGAIRVLDEFPYLVGVTPELPGLLQRFVDQNRIGGKHLIVCGSSQSMMQGLVRDAAAPLYGRAREIVQIKPLGASWITKGLRLSHPDESLPSYAVWGGNPRYSELASEIGNLWTAVEELVLDPLPFKREYERIHACIFVAERPKVRKKLLFSAKQIFHLLR